MRMFFVLVVLLVGVLFVAGAIHIQQGSNNTVEITVDKQKAEQTAESLLQEGEQALGQAEQAAAAHNANTQTQPQQQKGSFNR